MWYAYQMKWFCRNIHMIHLWWSDPVYVFVYTHKYMCACCMLLTLLMCHIIFFITWRIIWWMPKYHREIVSGLESIQAESQYRKNHWSMILNSLRWTPGIGPQWKKIRACIYLVSKHLSNISGQHNSILSYLILQLYMFSLSVVFIHFNLFYFIGCRVMPCHVMSFHIMPVLYHIKSYHIMSCHIMSCHIISYHIASHRIASHHIISCHVISYHIISYHITSYLTSHHIISHITSHHISHHITSLHNNHPTP